MSTKNTQYLLSEIFERRILYLDGIITCSCCIKASYFYPIKKYRCRTGAHSQLWGTIIPVCSLYAARKYDGRFGIPAIV